MRLKDPAPKKKPVFRPNHYPRDTPVADVPRPAAVVHERPAPRSYATGPVSSQVVRPSFHGSHAAPGSPAFKDWAARNAALDRAKHANDQSLIYRQATGDSNADASLATTATAAMRHWFESDPTEGGLGFKTKLDWRFFGQPARPSPRTALAKFKSDVSKSVLTDDQALQLYWHNLQEADAFDKATEAIRAKKGYTGIDIIDYPQRKGEAARKKLMNDPEYRRLTKDLDRHTGGVPDRMTNVVRANAMGLPLTNDTIEQYIKDAKSIVASGLTPEEVPGLVIPPDQMDALSTLKGQVAGRGYDKDQIEKMNFGQLIAAAMAPKKAGTYVGRVIQNAPKSTARAIINFPGGIAATLRAVQQDATDYAAGNQGKLPDIHYTHAGPVPLPMGGKFSGQTTENLGKQLGAFGKSFWDDPAKAFEEDPAGVTLALWGLVKGGGAAAGKIQTIRGRLPQERVITPGVTRSTVSKIVKGQADSPDAPLVVTMPGDPAPPVPWFKNIHGIDAPQDPAKVGNVAGHRQQPLTGIEAAIEDANARDIAAREQHIQLQNPKIRGQIGSPETHARELSQLNEAALHNQRTLEGLIERLRDPKLPTGNWLKETQTRLEAEIAHAQDLIQTETQNSGRSSGVGEIIIRNNQQLLETLPEMAKATKGRRKQIAAQIVQVKRRGDDLQRQIFNKHVDLNIPHPKSQTEIARLHQEISTAIKQRRNPVEIQRLRDRLDAVQNLGKEDPLESVKRALDTPDVDFNEYLPDATHEAPVNPVEIANGVLQDNFHAIDGDYAVQGVGHNVMDLINHAIDNLHEEPNRHYFPDNDMRHFDMLERVKTLARQHFGEDWDLPLSRITPEDRLRIRAFMGDVVRSAIDIEKSPRIAKAVEANQRGFRQDTRSFTQRREARIAGDAEEAALRGQKRFTAKTDKGIKVAWGRTAREAMAALERDGFKVEAIELSKRQRARNPTELTVQPAERGETLTASNMRTTRGPVSAEFRDMIHQDPAQMTHPEDIVQVLDRFDPTKDRDVFNAFRDEIVKRRDGIQKIVDDLGDSALRGATARRLDMIHSLENALERMDEFANDTWPKPGEVVPFTGRIYHAPEPEPIDTPTGGQMVVHGTDEDSLKANRDLSQDPPRMTFDDQWGSYNANRGIEGPNQWLFRQPTHTTHLRSSEDIGVAVDRGMYSRNVVDRFFQRLNDSLMETQKPIPGTKWRQRALMARSYATDEGHARRGYYVKVERLLAPVREAASKLTQHELIASTQAHLQGVLPSEMLAFYNKLIEMKEHLLKKENLPPELKERLRNRVPDKKLIDELIDTIKDKPEYKPHVEWLQRFKQYLGNEDYLADNLFGDVIGSDWRVSKDLKNAQKMWQKIVDDPNVGDKIGPEMHTYIGEAKKASHAVDSELVSSQMFPRHVLDNRRYQRQRLVGAVLHKDIHDQEAIYVGDSAKDTPAGRYLFRRVRSIEPARVMGERAKQWSGQSLVSGRINPSFANYYTGLTSAYSKSSALKFQREILDRYGVKVKAGWETYDGRKYVLWNAEKGRPSSTIGIRDMMDILNKNKGEKFGNDILDPTFTKNRQDIANTERPDRGITDPDDRRAQANGELYLIPRSVYNNMDRIQRGNQLNSQALRYFSKGTKAFRFVALALRPGYLIVNTVESAFRTGYFGGVSPVAFARGLKEKKEFRQEVTPDWLARSTLSRDILHVSHLGSKDARILAEQRAKLGDTMARWNRAPFFGNAIDVARWVGKGGPGDAILRGTSRAENYLRESMILSKQLKEARKYRYSKDRAPMFEVARRDKGIDAATGLPKEGLPYVRMRLFNRYFKGIDDQMRDLMRDIASDSPKHDEFRGKMDEIVKDVARVLGDFSKHDRQVLSQIFPFWRWMAFITKFVMWESPVHYPARTFLLQQLGQMGYNELSQMGVMPANIQGAIPVGEVHDKENPDGQIDKHITVMYTQAWNGMSSVPQMLGVDPATGKLSLGSGLIRNMNPFMQAAFTSLTMHDAGTQRQLKDRFGNPFDQTLPMYGEIFVANSLRAFWPLVLDYDYSTMADNSMPLIHKIVKADPPGPLAQPQSSNTQKLTAILTGIRTRELNLTKLQEKNLVDAATQIQTVYDSLGDGGDEPTAAQQRFNQRFEESYMRQLQYMSEWVDRYVDKSGKKDWRAAALQVAELNGP